MSATHSPPSGPVVACTGRNQLSVEARNSLSASSGARTAANVLPFGLRTRRCTSRLTGSQVNALPVYSGPSRSSR